MPDDKELAVKRKEDAVLLTAVFMAKRLSEQIPKEFDGRVVADSMVLLTIIEAMRIALERLDSANMIDTQQAAKDIIKIVQFAKRQQGASDESKH